jgi:cephalosporin hydroxylase
MASNSAKFIQLSDGTSVEEAILALQSAKGGSTKVDLSGLAKASDVEAVVANLNQLIADLKAGVYASVVDTVVKATVDTTTTTK